MDQRNASNPPDVPCRHPARAPRCAASANAASADDAKSLNELRDTVVNLLQGLVDRGVLTREQAEKMVRDAQSKAEVDAAAVAAQEKAEGERGARALRARRS
ncbi:MAG: putative porin [Pseudomonadota bacterium]